MTMDDTDKDAAEILSPVAATSRIASLDVMRGLAVLGISGRQCRLVRPAGHGLSGREPEPVSGHRRQRRGALDDGRLLPSEVHHPVFDAVRGLDLSGRGRAGRCGAWASLLRRRLFWLAVIALIHGLAFWYGDVLLLYAWSGLFVMLMRSMRARTLIGIGLAVTLLLGAMQAGATWLMVAGPPAITEAMNQGGPQYTAAMVTPSIAAYRSGWAGAMGQNLQNWLLLQGASLTMFVFSTVALMMLGLGLFKAGVFSGRAPNGVYVALIAVGGALLALLGVLEWREAMAPGRNPPDARPGGGRRLLPVFVTLAYVSLIVLATRRRGGLDHGGAAAGGPDGLHQLSDPDPDHDVDLLHAVGAAPVRTVPTMCRCGAWWLAVWALQLIWSPLWLSRFSMGPLEWVWRCLTYGRRTPISKARLTALLSQARSD
jgi:uncharacterized protein